MRQVDSWVARLHAADLERPDVAHLHHLTPLHEAVRTVWPDVPVVSHLHGTELKMLAGIEDPTRLARSGADHPWSSEWTARLRAWAGASDRLVVVSPQDVSLASALLPVEPDRIVQIGNCVDTELFAARSPGAAERRERWHHWLVEDPRGWRPGGDEGSVRCDPAAMSAVVDLAVGGALEVSTTKMRLGAL
jgi:hypothetical protein